MTVTRRTFLLWLASVGALAGCGGPSKKLAGKAAKHDITPEVNAYYKKHPEFFTFKKPTDLPKDLVWENGMDLPEIGSDQAKKGGTSYAALQDFPRTLRTVGPDSNGSFRPYLLDYTAIPLADRHPDKFLLYPGTARAWAVDKKSKTVFVKLDPDAKWSDGVPLTTDDFLFMFFFYQSKYIVAPWYNNWYGTQYTNITKYDDHTFSISVPDAKPDMDERVLGLTGVPQHFYTELGNDFVQRYQWKYVPTTGTYTIHHEDIDIGQSITLTRIKNWWAKDKKFYKNRFNPNYIQFNVIRDVSKQFDAFKRGDIDAFGLTLAEYWYDKLPNNDPEVQKGYIHKATFYNRIPRPPWGLSINMSRALLDDQDIRLGINYATDWQMVIDRLMRGDPKRLDSAQHGYGEFSNKNVKARPFDIDKAQEHFAKAGFKNRGQDGILVNANGDRLSFSLTTGYQRFGDALTILKQQAAKAGLDLRLEMLDSTSAWKKVQEKKHDIYFGAFALGLAMYPRFWEFYDSVNAYDNAFIDGCKPNPNRKIKTQTNNLEEFADCNMDKMITEYRASSEKQEMVELSHRMIKLHHDYASFVPAFYWPFYRVGYWRWVHHPKGFDEKYSSGGDQYFVSWLEPGERQQTLEAKKEGKTFPVSIEVYDQYKE